MKSDTTYCCTYLAVFFAPCRRWRAAGGRSHRWVGRTAVSTPAHPDRTSWGCGRCGCWCSSWPSRWRVSWPPHCSVGTRACSDRPPTPATGWTHSPSPNRISNEYKIIELRGIFCVKLFRNKLCLNLIAARKTHLIEVTVFWHIKKIYEYYKIYVCLTFNVAQTKNTYTHFYVND